MRLTLPSLIFTRMMAFAFKTPPTVSTVSEAHDRVLWRVFMPAWAVSYCLQFFCMSEPANPDPIACGQSADNILSIGNWLKMVWANALSVPAKMIYLKAFGNWSNEFLVRQTVGILAATSAVISNNRIALFVEAQCPTPATRFWIYADAVEKLFCENADSHLRYLLSDRLWSEPLGALTPCGSFHYSAEASA